MQRSVKALVAVSGLDSADVQTGIPTDGSLELVGVVSGVEPTLRAALDRRPDVVLVASDGSAAETVELVGALTAQEAERPVIVLSASNPNGFLNRAFDAGAADVLLFPQTREVLDFAVAKALARRARAARLDTEHKCRLVCVLGPKGGTGKTLTTCNLAVALASAGERVLLVDLDLQFGDVALTLGLLPEKTIYDLAVSPGSLDEDKLADYVSHHDSGAHVLLAPSRPDQASSVTTDLLREVYRVASDNYDFIVVDTPPGFTAEVIATIDSSTDLVMVGMLDALSLKNTKLGLETLELMGYRPEQVTVVLNRAMSRVGISQSDVVAVLGRDPHVYIPSDREVPRTVNEGVPIVLSRPGSEPAIAFRQLAAVYIGDRANAETPTPRASQPRIRLFGRKS